MPKHAQSGCGHSIGIDNRRHNRAMRLSSHFCHMRIAPNQFCHINDADSNAAPCSAALLPINDGADIAAAGVIAICRDKPPFALARLIVDIPCAIRVYPPPSRVNDGYAVCNLIVAYPPFYQRAADNAFALSPMDSRTLQGARMTGIQHPRL